MNNAKSKPRQSARKNPASGPAASAGKPAKTAKPWGIIFWVAFFTVVTFLFIHNRESIRQTLAAAGSGVVVARDQKAPGISASAGNEIAETSDLPSADVSSSAVPSGAVLAVDAPVAGVSADAPPGETSAVDAPSAETSALAGTEAPAPDSVENAPGPVPQNAGLPEPAAERITNAPSGAAEAIVPGVSRNRAMYFLNVDSDGLILRTKVNRSLPASDSPLTDTLSALLAGPGPDEQRRGLISLIPAGTRVVNATVRGTTAYINFSEDFQFNTYGVEGYAGALRQVVWTATEFSNVADVQILIEGRRVDYLGEGVWIGSPVTREMF